MSWFSKKYSQEYVNDLNDRISDQIDQIDARDEDIAALQETLAQKEEMHATLVKKKDEEILGLRSQVGEKDEEILGLKGEISRLKRQLEEGRKLLSVQQDEINGLTTERDRLNRKISGTPGFTSTEAYLKDAMMLIAKAKKEKVTAKALTLTRQSLEQVIIWLDKGGHLEGFGK